MSEMTYGEALAKMAHDMKEKREHKDSAITPVYSDTVLGYLLDIQDILEEGANAKHTPYIAVEKQPILGLVERAIELARADTGKRGNCLLCAHYQRAEDQRVAHECMDRLRRLAELGNCPLTKDEVDNLERFI